MQPTHNDFSTLFQFNPIPNWVYNVSTFEILEVNQAAIHLYGYSRDEFLTKTILDLRTEEEIPRMLETRAHTIEKEGILHFGIFNHLKKSGERILMDIYGHRLQFAAQDAIMISAINVTEIQQQLTELKDSEKKLKAASSIAHLGYWRLELDGQQLSWSEEVYEIWGRSQSDFPVDFDRFLTTIHPDDQKEFFNEQMAAFNGEKTLDFIHRILLPDHRIKWVHEIGRIERNKEGQPIAFEGTVRDITLQKEEEQRLKILESVITNTHDSVIITEADPVEGIGHRIVYVNQAFTKLTGYTKEEVIGKSPKLLQGPNTDYEEIARLSTALKNWEPCEISTINYKKSGEEFWINFTVNPVADEKGWYTHWIAIEKDITQQKNRELEKALLASISTVFSPTMDLHNSLQLVCEEVSRFGGFSFSEIWLPSTRQDKLQIKASCARDKAGEDFFQLSANIHEFELNEGIQGHVWASKKAWVADKSDDKQVLLRMEAARAADIQSLMGIPLLHDGNMVGVMIVGAQKPRQSIKQLAPTLSKLENYIGSEIHRKKIETELERLFQSLPDLICLSDFNGQFLKINSAGCALLGYAEEEIIGQHYSRFIHPEDEKISHVEIGQLIAGNSNFQYENRYLTKSGKIIWLSWNCSSSIEEGIIFASAKDITAEKKLGELLEESLSLARMGGWEIDLVNSKLYWSDMVHTLHGTDPANFIPNISEGIEFYRPDFRELVKSAIQVTIETAAPFDFEAIIITTEKKELWVRVIGKAEMREGRCIRIIGSFQDIHDRKTTELRLQSIMDDLPGASFQYLVYPDGSEELRSVNKAAEKIWGLKREDCIKNPGLVWNQVKLGGDFIEVMRNINLAITNQSKWQSQWRYIYPNGQVGWQEGSGTPYFLPDGTVVFNSMVFDITEEKKATLLYEETSKMARVGSWELNLKDAGNDSMYWSPMVRTILEVDKNYTPSLTGGFEFYEPESRNKIQAAVKRLIGEQVPFDEELLIRTAKGKLRWIRCMGKGEFVLDECVRIFGSYQDIDDRKKAAAELKRAFEDRTKILESIGDAFFTMDRHFVVTYWNRIAEELLHVKREQVLHQNLWDVFPDAVKLPSYTYYNQVLATGQAVRFEDYYGIWLEVNAYPTEDGVSVFFRDITLKKEADMRLHKAYEERNTILESIGDAFFAVDNNWIVTYWNQMAEKVLHKSREEIVGRHLWTEYADAIDSDFYRNYQLAKETGESISFEEYYPTQQIWFEVTAYPSESGLSVYFKDITLRKEADIRLRDANERFEKVSEVTNDAIWDWNVVENSLFWGNGFSTLFGYEVEKITPTLDAWTSHIPEHLRELVLQSLQRVLDDRTQSIWQEEYQYLKADGTYANVIDRGIVMRDKKGQPVRMVGAMRDITYQKVYEQELRQLNEDLKSKIRELEQANEELEQFAFIASHDLQEPLRMISSFMDQLRRKYGADLDPKAHQYIHFAVDGAKRMKKIILDLLEYSRAGRVSGAMEWIHLEEIVADYMLLRKKIIADKAAQLVQDPLPVVQGYRAPLTQTLHALLDNAVKYSRTGVNPVVELRVSEAAKEWIIEVKDNGIGIDPQFHDKIFIIFQRLHNRDEYEGTGIGLSIVKKHVESWGGKIWVESEVGSGTSFYFTIKK
ncbi:PAS domain S-box protein [Flavihumibacter sp. UBA7668]|uniref:PAS domain S-box protein n=1 Tax=Flavihumibacter sp. UBA7668 TaxID=1946542 RepID=UPI0025C48026|nr:PAS domain S-box protein [Flavihumibacter sp. UBA7668]